MMIKRQLPIHKIWVVDDNPDHSELIIDTLLDIDHNFSIENKPDGESALSDLNILCKTRRPLPNIILMDIKMPRMNGIETLERIKVHPLLQHIPVAMLSTSTNEQEVSRCLQAGAILHIAKPLTEDFFKKNIMPIINRQS